MTNRERTPSTPATDTDFHLYHELMSFKVKDILVILTPFDAFIMEGNGSLAARIVNEYHGLNLSRPPRLYLATTVEEAIHLLTRHRFDLVLTMPVVAGTDGTELAGRIKAMHPRLPVFMLTHNPMGPDTRRSQLSPVDRTWVWSGDADLLLAIVKNLEDHRNVGRDTQKAAVRVILLVEDDPAYRSWFVPRMYREVVRQTQAVLAEGLNEEHRLLKMRARPKILIAGDYESALALYRQHREHIFTVIADTRFSRKGKVDDLAGLRLLERIRAESADLPLLLLSSETSNRRLAEKIPASFLDKNGADLDRRLRQYFIDHLGFGDFVFRTPLGTEVARAANMISFERLLAGIDVAVLRYHAEGNHLSNWVMARAEIGLARRLHRSVLAGCSDDELRRHVCSEVRAMLRRRQQGVITTFDPDGFDAELTDFVRAGSGQLGGKALGLAFLAGRLRDLPPLPQEEISVTIPRTFVLASDLFDTFLATNRLDGLEQLEDDGAIDRMFRAATLPEQAMQALAVLLSQADHPIIVRSSSTLEDAHTTPYAGLFATRVLANNDNSCARRLEQLADAVKLVYASAYHRGPRAFAALHRPQPLSRIGPMAVMIQQLIGTAHGDLFFPAMAGVVQSRNFYPLAPMRPEDGIVLLALGLGNTVVEGGKSLRFCPKHPGMLPQFSTIDDILANRQTTFAALDLKQHRQHGDNAPPLVERPVEAAAAFYPQLFSWYSPEDHAIRDMAGSGHPVLTFRPLLQRRLSPIAAVLYDLLDIGRTGMGCEVELEFAVDLTSKSPRLAVLQLRPMLQGGPGHAVRLTAAEKQKAVCRSCQVLGRGRQETVTDILFISQQTFTAAEAQRIVRDIAALNAGITGESRRYLLIGPGRWGSMDPLLGIPVRWQDISGVMAIIELPVAGRNVDPSQGTHFFQNITALGLAYLTIDKRCDHVDLDWFARQPAVREETFVRHLRPEHPLCLKIDSETSEAALFTIGNDTPRE